MTRWMWPAILATGIVFLGATWSNKLKLEDAYDAQVQRLASEAAHRERVRCDRMPARNSRGAQSPRELCEHGSIMAGGAHVELPARPTWRAAYLPPLKLIAIAWLAALAALGLVHLIREWRRSRRGARG